MENPENPAPRIITIYNLKQALFSIAIGLTITLIGDLAALMIDLLHGFQSEVVGGFAGSVKYWTSWKYNKYN